MRKSKALLQRILPLLGAALLLAVSFFPYQEKKNRLRIVAGVWPSSEALLVASDLQILPPDRFQTIEMPWSSAVVRAFGSGAADVAVVTLDSLLRMREAGQKLKVLMVLSQSTGGDAILGNQKIQRLRDIKGKRVGVERSSGTYLLANALESIGLTMMDIETVPMFQTEMEPALQMGQIDAVVVTEPWLTILSRQGTHSLYDSNELKVPILYLLVASDQACTSSRAELMSLIEIEAEMAKKIWAGKHFAGIDAVLRRENMKEAELPPCLKRLRPLNKAENEKLLKQLPQLAAQMEDLMFRSGMLQTKPAGGPWIDSSFAQEVAP